MTTTGVGDIFPANDAQRAYNAGAIVVGVVFYAYIVGILTAAMTSTAARASADSIAAVDRAARAARLAPALRERLVAYRAKRIAHFTPKDELAQLSALPFTLRKEVALALHCRSPVPAALAGAPAGAGAAAWAALLSGRAGAAPHLDTQLVFECNAAAEPRWAGVGEAVCWRGDEVGEVLVVASGELRPLSDAEEAAEAGAEAALPLEGSEAEAEAEEAAAAGGSGSGAAGARRSSCIATDRLFAASAALRAGAGAGAGAGAAARGSGAGAVIGLAAAAEGAAPIAHRATLVASRPTLVYALDTAAVRALAARFAKVAAAVEAAARVEAEAAESSVVKRSNSVMGEAQVRVLTREA